jgi:hypothetical protein
VKRDEKSQRLCELDGCETQGGHINVTSKQCEATAARRSRSSESAQLEGPLRCVLPSCDCDGPRSYGTKGDGVVLHCIEHRGQDFTFSRKVLRAMADGAGALRPVGGGCPSPSAPARL